MDFASAQTKSLNEDVPEAAGFQRNIGRLAPRLESRTGPIPMQYRGLDGAFVVGAGFSSVSAALFKVFNSAKCGRSPWP
jgi:hypothetical protein